MPSPLVLITRGLGVMRGNAGVFVFVIPPVWLSTCSVLLSTCSVLKTEREEGGGGWLLAVKISAKSNFLVAAVIEK